MLTEMATGNQAGCLVSPAIRGKSSENSDGFPHSSGLPAPPLPKLRGDLIISRQTGQDGVSAIIKDPVRGKFIRLKEPEYFIAQQLDGSTSLETVCQRVEKRFSAQLEPEILEKFVGSLRRNRLLEEHGGKLAKGYRKQARIQGNLFYLRFKICDPNRLFDHLIGAVRFCFSPSFVAFSAI